MHVIFPAFLILAAGPAIAGPVDDLLGTVIGADASYWAEAVAVVSALLGLLSAVVPDSKISALPGGKIWLAMLTALASNWGAAKNDPAAN